MTLRIRSWPCGADGLMELSKRDEEESLPIIYPSIPYVVLAR